MHRIAYSIHTSVPNKPVRPILNKPPYEFRKLSRDAAPSRCLERKASHASLQCARCLPRRSHTRELKHEEPPRRCKALDVVQEASGLASRNYKSICTRSALERAREGDDARTVV